MCGIFGIKKENEQELDKRNRKIQLRGQDHTNIYKHKDFTFVHNLLSVTGEFTPQPFIDGNIICVYNGEIYNHEFVKSDGEVLIPLYKKYGTDFAKYLDGEFAIALFDYDKDIAVFVTDPFKTKPLFIKGIEFSTYRSGCDGYTANPNEIVVRRISNLETLKRKPVVEWDLNQHKTTYDDWIKAFEMSIKKRAKKDCFIGLSSGYDSGAMACEMLKQGIDFKAYTYMGWENKDILDKRVTGLNVEYFEPQKEVLDFLKENIDDETFTIKYKSGRGFTILSEQGCVGVGTFCKMASEEGRKVCLSSQGADEILSDYSLFPDQSELDSFPEDLKLWNNFNYGCQESYLMKEEYAGGAFNIETRYPFLDKDLVQEFLWLTPELKNRYYKAPLREYLIRNNYPFEEGVKLGFSVNV